MPDIALDPLHPRQMAAFTSNATEILYGGAAGGGKSHLMRIKAIFFALNVERLSIYLFRRIHDDLWKNHMEGVNGFIALLAPLVQSGDVKITSQPPKITFTKTGSTINLCHCQYEADVVKYQGAEIGVLLIDELTHFTEKQYTYLRGRCRVPNNLRGNWAEFKRFHVCDQFPQILCGANPGGVGHNWVKATFISPKPPETIWQTPDDEGGMLRQYIPAKLDDNPSIDKAKYERQLSGLKQDWLVKAMRDGSWDITAGGAFDDLWDADIHVMPRFKIPETWYISKSFDWGSSKPYSVGWWAESDGSDYILPDGSSRPSIPGDMFLIHELYGWCGKPNEGLRESTEATAEKILAVEKELGFSGILSIADSAIFDSANGRNKSIADDFADYGILWTPCRKAPGSRIAAVQKLREMLRGSLERDGKPGIFIFDHCRQWIRTVPVLQRDERKPDDVDTTSEDHAFDQTGYQLLYPKPRITSGNMVFGY